MRTRGRSWCHRTSLSLRLMRAYSLAGQVTGAGRRGLPGLVRLRAAAFPSCAPEGSSQLRDTAIPAPAALCAPACAALFLHHSLCEREYRTAPWLSIRREVDACPVT